MFADLAYLNFFRPFCDPVAAMVAEDMLKWLVAGIANTAMDLHRPIGRVANEAVRAIVTHADLVGEPFGNFRFGHLIHLLGSFVDQQT